MRGAIMLAKHQRPDLRKNDNLNFPVRIPGEPITIADRSTEGLVVEMPMPTRA